MQNQQILEHGWNDILNSSLSEEACGAKLVEFVDSMRPDRYQWQYLAGKTPVNLRVLVSGQSSALRFADTVVDIPDPISNSEGQSTSETLGQAIQNVGVCLENKIDDKIDQTVDEQVARTERPPPKRQAAVIVMALMLVAFGGAAGDFYSQPKDHRHWPFVSMALSMGKALPWVVRLLGWIQLYRLCSKIF